MPKMDELTTVLCSMSREDALKRVGKLLQEFAAREPDGKLGIMMKAKDLRALIALIEQGLAAAGGQDFEGAVRSMIIALDLAYRLGREEATPGDQAARAYAERFGVVKEVKL